MKFVLAPDSFKGSMSAVTVCERMTAAIYSVMPEARVVSIPVADGGEGSIDAFRTFLGGEKISVRVKNAFFEDKDTAYLLYKDTAVIEAASCVGLPEFESRKDPSVTTTFGIGQQILDAAGRGAKNIILCLGGSCTNDCGLGLASALGARFFDKDGAEFVPVGKTLEKIASVKKRIDPRLKDVNVTAMCDVNNPLYGQNGAAYVFAPQKGADEKMVKMLDFGLRHAASKMDDALAALPGMGAAGGLGYSAAYFLNAELKSGIDLILDLSGFDREIADCDYVFTGEGRFDNQSLAGKAVSGIAKRARQQNKKVIVLAGEITADEAATSAAGIHATFSINQKALPFKESKKDAPNNLYQTTRNIVKLLKQ